MPIEQRDTTDEIIHLDDFSGGFNDQRIPTHLANNQASDAQDVLCTPRGVFKRPGGSVIFTKPSGTDPVLGLFGKFRRAVDLTELFRWDKLRMHRMAGAAWDEILLDQAVVPELVTNGGFDADTDWTKGTGWTIAAGVATAAAASSDLSQAIDLFDGTQYELTFTISNFSAGDVTPKVRGTSGTTRSSDGVFTETITAGSASPSLLEFTGAAFSADIDVISLKLKNPSAWTGSNSDFFTAQNFGSFVYFSNGEENIQRHQFATLTRGLVHASAPSCKYMTRFAERIFCGAAGGSSRRVQWHVRGDATDWSGRGSGSIDLKLIEGDITGIDVLPDHMVIYQDGGIMIATETGDVDNPLEYFPNPGPGIGLFAPLTLVNLGRRHLFLGSEPGQGFSVYELSLGGLRDIGNPIRRFLNDVLDIATAESSHASYDPQTRCYILWLQGTGSPAMKGIAFQLETETWGAKWNTPQPSVAIPTYSHAALKGSSGFARGEFLFVGMSTGDVIRYSPTLERDGASDIITGIWESKDFRIEPPLYDILGMDVLVATRGGGDIKVSISTDGGATFEADQTNTMTAGTREQIKTFRFGFDKAGKSVRVRIKNDTLNESLDLRELTIVVHRASQTRDDT